MEVLRNDQRVCAAWLHGSSSRGEDDALSDLDLWVVVSDQSADDFVDNRRAYAARPARPVLVLEALQNAPPDGAYLLVLYAGEVGPLHVDWFWQPESHARIPDDVDALFDRVGLPLVSGAEWRRETHQPPGSPLGPHATRVDVLTHKITFFWAMSLIVAKHIARRKGETIGRMTRRIAGTLTEAVQLLDSDLSLPGRDAALRPGLETETPVGQFEVLYGLARDATRLHDELVDQGAAIPSEAISYIYRFFELTESMAKAR